MWPFRPKSQDTALVLAKQIHGLGLRVQALEESLQALQLAHERLRGRFYALKGPEVVERKPVPQTKAEILREFGFVPGKPAPHT